MRRERGIFICLTGIDGSGKTTLAKSLANTIIEGKRFNLKYAHGSFEPFILKPLIIAGKMIFLRAKNEFNDFQGYFDAKRDFSNKHRLLSLFYQHVLFSAYFLRILRKIRIPLMFGNHIISDRYVYDSLINLGLNLGYSNKEIQRTIQRYLRSIPKPDLVFLIDVPEEVAYWRKNDLPSIDYLRQRRRIYLYLEKEYEMVILDGTKDLRDLKAIIQSRVVEFVRGYENE